jgi:mRNA interferase MazF
MPKYQQGDILLLPYPYSDFSAVKKRPVIVVGSQPSIFGDYLVTKITTNIRADVFSFYLDNTLVSNALPVPSEIRSNEIFTAHESIVLKKLSALNLAARQLLATKIQTHFEVVI